MIICGTNITMVRGDSEGLTVSTSGDHTLGAGDKVEFTVRQSAISTGKAIHKTVTSFPDGIATIQISPADTAQLPFGRYVYDIQLTMANGEVHTIVPCSTFKIAEEVSY